MNIDAHLVARLISNQFPQWANRPIYPVEMSGWDNRTFHLGPDMSVRLPSAAWYSEQVAKEQTWLPRLAPRLPLTIPTPLAMGEPDEDYPWHWSIYRWIEGDNATWDRIANREDFARVLAEFLMDLQRIDPLDGPVPGTHNFYRGGPVQTYDEETRTTITALHDRIDTDVATSVWQAALQSTWEGPPVWVHGDVHATNLLVRQGQLCAVIDFGCLSVGDPACDLTIAWTFFTGESRSAFKSALPLDDGTWARARGWALWKALITIANPGSTTPQRMEEAGRVVQDVLNEHRSL